MTNHRAKAFCIDFNWDVLGRFASPGLYATASPREHMRWYQELGVNTIQSFCVSHNGYAWYDSDIALRTPGMRGSFLGELTALGHDAGMRVMGYFSPGANGYWQVTRPELSHRPVWNRWHIPFTTDYLDYLGRMIEEVLTKVPIDGFMIDWLWNVDPIWLPCEIIMYQELLGEAFPGRESVGAEQVIEFKRRAVERAWTRIHGVAKSTKEDCILWLSCNDLTDPQVKDTIIPSQVDWLMNEHPNPDTLEAAARAIGPHTTLIQCVCGWGEEHDAAMILNDPRYNEVGLYGFARPDPGTTLPPKGEGGNARNIEIMAQVFKASA